MNERQKAELKKAIEIIDRVRNENIKFERTKDEVIKFCNDLIDVKFIILDAIYNYRSKED